MSLKIALIIYNILVILALGFIVFSEIKQSKSVSQIETVLNMVYF